MLPRSLRWAYVIPIIAAQVLAFFTMTEFSQDRFIGPTAIVKVSGTSDSAPSQQVSAMLIRVSRQTGAGVARETVDAGDPNRHRTLEVVAQDSASRPGEWTVHGYRDFDPSIRTSVVDLRVSGSSDPRGYYFVFGSESSVHAFDAGFRALGYEVASGPYESLLEMSFWTVGGSGLRASAALVLLMIVLTAGGILAAPRRAALVRLSGAGGHTVLRREAHLVCRRTFPWFATAVPAAVALGLHNGLAQYGAFLFVAFILWMVFTTPVIATHLVCVWLLRRQAIAAAVRGDRPAQSAIVLAFAARAVATLILVSSVFASAQTTGGTESRRAAREDREAAGNAAQLWVSGSLGASARNAAFWARLGAFVREAQSRHEAFLVHGEELTIDAHPELGPIPVLVVDPTYLDRQPLFRSDHRRVRGTAGATEVLVPDRLRHMQQELMTAVRGQTLQDPTGTPPVDVRAGTLEDGQRLYTYSTDPVRLPARVADPVIVVEPNGSSVFSDETYGSWITSGEVLFADTHTAEAAIDRHHLRQVFLAVFPVAQAAADREHRLGAERRIAAASAAAAVAVALFAAIGTVSLLRRRQGAANFVRFASGWSYLHRNRGLLAVEVGLLVLASATGVNAFSAARAITGPLSTLASSSSSATASLLCASAVAFLVTAVAVGVGATSSIRSISTRSRDN